MEPVEMMLRVLFLLTLNEIVLCFGERTVDSNVLGDPNHTSPVTQSLLDTNSTTSHGPYEQDNLYTSTQPFNLNRSTDNHTVGNISTGSPEWRTRSKYDGVHDSDSIIPWLEREFSANHSFHNEPNVTSPSTNANYYEETPRDYENNNYYHYYNYYNTYGNNYHSSYDNTFSSSGHGEKIPSHKIEKYKDWLSRKKDTCDHHQDGRQGEPPVFKSMCQQRLENLTLDTRMLDRFFDKYNPAYCFLRCFPCDDVVPRCCQYGTCCSPQVMDTDVCRFLNISTGMASGSQPGSRPTTDEKRGVCQDTGQCFHLLIRSCPVGYPDDQTRRLCKTDLPATQINLTTETVVMDAQSGVSYYNVYCAQCNNIKQTLPWSIGFHCKTLVKMRSAMDEKEFMRMVKSSGDLSTCKMSNFPLAEGVPYCDPGFHTSNLITRCNESGLETGEDPLIKEACDSGPMDLAERVTFNNGDVVFKNMDCFLCNLQLVWDRVTGGYCFPSRSPSTPPFQFMFGSNTKTPDGEGGSDPDSACDVTEWKDPQGLCRRLQCSEGKSLINDTCVTAIPEIKGLPYVIKMWMLPTDHSIVTSSSNRPISAKSSSADILAEAVFKKIENITQTFKMVLKLGVKEQNVTSLVCRPDCSNSSFLPQRDAEDVMLPVVGGLELFLYALPEIPRDEVETYLLQSFFNETLTTVDDWNGLRTHYKLYFAQEIFDVDDIGCLQQKGLVCATSFRTNTKGDVILFTDIVDEDFLRVHPTLMCPYLEVRDGIELDLSPMTVPPVTKVAFALGDVRIQLDHRSELNRIIYDQGRPLNVCREVLDSKLTTNLDVTRGGVSSDDVISLAQYVLTVVCMTLSLCCLAVTVFTYCLFPCLRTLAGCNTLGLCVSLALAQLSLLSASHTKDPGPLCTVVGILNHFCWLVMFTWSFLCCLHMVKVFTSTIGHHSQVSRSVRAERRAVLTNLLISVTGPAAVVVTVVVTSYFRSAGETIGYGHGACTMDNPLSIQVPLVVLVTTNVLFFLVVMGTIWKLRRHQSDVTSFPKHDRKDLAVYVSLSSLTGMFWLLAVLAELFHSDALRFLAILLNGLQGVFIFVSFTLKRRVWALYLEKYGRTFCLDKSNKQHSGISTMKQ